MDINPDFNFTMRELARFSQAPYQDFLTDHSLVVDCIGNLIEEWDKRSPVGPFWQELVEPLVLKIILTASSLENLIDGTQIGKYAKEPHSFPDISTMYTLARAQLEAYLTFFYLYLQPEDEDEFKLRYHLYVIHSLTIRQGIDSPLVEHIEKKQRELLRLTDYRIQVQNNPVFIGYSKQNQNRLLSGNTAKEIGWSKLIEQSKLITDLMLNNYDIYANHAHSEYTSLLQVRTYILQPHETLKTRATELKSSLMLLSLFTRELASFLQLEDVYNSSDETLRKKMARWAGTITGITLAPSL